MILLLQCKGTPPKQGSSRCSKKDYIEHYGEHFNKALLQYATDNMTTSKGKLVPITEGELRKLCNQYGISIENTHATIYDTLYIANMCKADFLGSSIPDNEHLCKYIKDVIDDVDGYEGLTFNRWYADIYNKGIELDWNKYI